MDDNQKKEPGQKSSGDQPPPKDAAASPMQPSPALIEFAKAPVIESPDEADWPLPEELLRNRREWAKVLKEKNTRQGGDLHMDMDKEPESKAPADRDPPQR